MPTPLSKKLRIQPGFLACAVHVPEDYFELLAPLPVDIEFVEEGSELDFLHIFATKQSELMEDLEKYLSFLKYDGIFWISYPKGSAKKATDLSRDVFWEILKDRSLRPVTQISVDETWSAIRFRPDGEVGTK